MRLSDYDDVVHQLYGWSETGGDPAGLLSSLTQAFGATGVAIWRLSRRRTGVDVVSMGGGRVDWAEHRKFDRWAREIKHWIETESAEEPRRMEAQWTGVVSGGVILPGALIKPIIRRDGEALLLAVSRGAVQNPKGFEIEEVKAFDRVVLHLRRVIPRLREDLFKDSDKTSGGENPYAVFFEDGKLTCAEMLVACEVVGGKSAAEIALSLKIRRGTVYFHLKNIFAKLGVSSQIELMRIVIRRCMEERR